MTSDLTVVANVGDNYWFQGLYVCPDIDIAVYTLAGISDSRTGWGIRGDTFNVLGQLGRLGQETWFRMGDTDLAIAMVRTGLLRSGKTLTQATSLIGESLGAKAPVLPATDSPVETLMVTNAGTMHLQEFWVKKRGSPRVTRVKYDGAREASPTRQVARALSDAERVIVCPANPITSIGPILAIGGMKQLLSRSEARVVAVSPMVGSRPYSGPAGRLMRQLDMRPDSVGVASLYSDFVDLLLIDGTDAEMRDEVERTGVSCAPADTRMGTTSQARRLASVLLEA